MLLSMYPSLQLYCLELTRGFVSIAGERQRQLGAIAAYINDVRRHHQPVNLIYICTHNSRRSHFGQVWAQAAAHYYGIAGVRAFSGGTEATAFHPHAIAALKRAGFHIGVTESGVNPRYQVFYDDDLDPVCCFSKIYDDPSNPQRDFGAILTCSDAEQNCPFIPGAAVRISTPYADPKAADGTPGQEAAYDERCRQIALETLYVFSLIR